MTLPSFINRTEVLSVLQGFNPWWASPYQSPHAFERVALHVCWRYLTDTKIKRAVLLSGPRRVGKTIILHQIARHLCEEYKDAPSVLYLSLDHPLLKMLSLPDILSVYHETTHPAGKPTYLLLDEIQYAADWQPHVKVLVDHHPEYRILATGSASLSHRQDVAESGAGRWLTVRIPTLSFYEFVYIRQSEGPDIEDGLRPSKLLDKDEAYLVRLSVAFKSLMPLFQRYLIVGGFPETANMDNVRLAQALLREDVVERVLKRDMASLFRIRNLNELEKLFIFICLHSGKIFSVSGCSKDLGISKVTVSNYLEALEQANLIYRLPPAHIGGKKSLRQQYKVYLIDAALRNAVLLKGEEILRNSDELGCIVETTVLRHLFAFYYPDKPQIAYWKDPKTDREVDAIIRVKDWEIAVEVKYSEQKFDFRRASGISAYCQERSPRSAFLVNRGDLIGQAETIPGSKTRAITIPAHVFTYLLGSSERRFWN
jgi:predicted AAA+ superfamily ATPase